MGIAMTPAGINDFSRSTQVVSDVSPGRPRPALVRRFGDTVDVRNRGALRMLRLAGRQAPAADAPAVVRVWHGDACRELSVHDARALAAQLVEAASYAEQQNRG